MNVNMNIKDLLNDEFPGNKIASSWLREAIKHFRNLNANMNENDLFQKIKKQFLRNPLNKTSHSIIPSSEEYLCMWDLRNNAILEIKSVQNNERDNIVEMILSDGYLDVAAQFSSQSSLYLESFVKNARIIINGLFQIDDGTILMHDYNVIKIIPNNEIKIKHSEIARPVTAFRSDYLQEELDFDIELQEILEKELREISSCNFDNIPIGVGRKRRSFESATNVLQSNKKKKDDLILSRILADLNKTHLLSNGFIPEYLSTDDIKCIHENVINQQSQYKGISYTLKNFPNFCGKYKNLFAKRFEDVEKIAEEILKESASPENEKIEDAKFTYNPEVFNFLREVGSTCGVNGETKSFTGFIISNFEKINPYLTVAANTNKKFEPVNDVSDRLYYFDESSKMPNDLEIKKDLMNSVIINESLDLKIGIAKVTLAQIGDLYCFHCSRYSDADKTEFRALKGINFLAFGQMKYLMKLESQYIREARETGISANAHSDMGGESNLKIKDETYETSLGVLYIITKKDSQITQYKILFDKLLPVNFVNPLYSTLDAAILTKNEIVSFRSCKECGEMVFNSYQHFYKHVTTHTNKVITNEVKMKIKGIEYKVNKIDLIKMYLEHYKQLHEIESFRQYFKETQTLSTALAFSAYFCFYLGTLFQNGNFGEMQSMKKENKAVYVFKRGSKSCFKFNEKEDVMDLENFYFDEEIFILKIKQIIYAINNKK